MDHSHNPKLYVDITLMVTHLCDRKAAGIGTPRAIQDNTAFVFCGSLHKIDVSFEKSVSVGWRGQRSK